jgi:hypothetical protein
MAMTYLTTRGLAARIPYDVRTIREQLKDKLFFEGVHYVRPNGPRSRILYIWEAIERDLLSGFAPKPVAMVPLSRGGMLHG